MIGSAENFSGTVTIIENFMGSTLYHKSIPITESYIISSFVDGKTGGLRSHDRK